MYVLYVTFVFSFYYPFNLIVRLCKSKLICLRTIVKDHLYYSSFFWAK